MVAGLEERDHSQFGQRWRFVGRIRRKNTVAGSSSSTPSQSIIQATTQSATTNSRNCGHVRKRTTGASSRTSHTSIAFLALNIVFIFCGFQRSFARRSLTSKKKQNACQKETGAQTTRKNIPTTRASFPILPRVFRSSDSDRTLTPFQQETSHSPASKSDEFDSDHRPASVRVKEEVFARGQDVR